MGGKLGVDASLKVLAAVGELVVDGLDVVKAPSLAKLRKVLELVDSVVDIAAAAPAALPELAELDAEDAAKLGAAAYAVVKRVVDKLKA